MKQGSRITTSSFWELVAMIFPITKHFENAIHTALIFITTAVFNSTVLGSRSSKLPTPRNISSKTYLMYFPSFFPQILFSSFCRNFFFLLVTYPRHSSCFGQYRGYPTSKALQIFSQWVTELESCYFRKYTFELNLILCINLQRFPTCHLWSSSSKWSLPVIVVKNNVLWYSSLLQ